MRSSVRAEVLDCAVKNGYAPTMAGRPRSFDSEDVIEKAMHVFWSRGFEGTGIADLEAATGLGRQSLYGAFGDKGALFGRVVEHYFERVLRPGLIDVLEADGSGRAAIEHVFETWVSLASSPDFHGCLVGNTASRLEAVDAATADVLARKLRRMEDAFVRAIGRGIERGEIRADVDPRSTARALLAIAQGLAVITRVRREPAFVRGVVLAARSLLD